MPWQPVRQADATLVAQLADGLARRIDEQGLRCLLYTSRCV